MSTCFACRCMVHNQCDGMSCDCPVCMWADDTKREILEEV